MGDFVISDEDMKMAQEQDFMENIIKQRNEDINLIAEVMRDINQMAKDLFIEVKIGGEKLE